MKYNWYCLASFLGWKEKNVAINTFNSFKALLIAPIMISVASRQETRERAAKPLFFLTLHNSSLRASSPIWASEASLARTRERAASPPARAFSRDLFHSPKQESLLAGYHNSVSFRVRLSHDFSRTHASCRHHRFPPSPQISIRSGTYGYL